MLEKRLCWLGSSLDDLKTFPADARRLAGFQLRRIQLGLDPNDWKPFSIVGKGVREIRIHTELEHRILYVAKFAEGVYVLHAFEKRTRKVSRHDLDLARGRLSALLAKNERTPPDESRHTMSVRITRSNRNVFRDLGFDSEESEHLKIRANLMIQVQKRIAAGGYRQADVAKMLRITQPRVSDLLRGRIDLFSTDTLIDMLARLGISVRLTLKPSRIARRVA